MKLTATPKCPKYFKLDKSTCKCTMKKNYLDKILKQRTKKPNKKAKPKNPKKAKTLKQRLPKININPKIVKEKCPPGTYYNKEYDICEIDALNPKELKKAKKKTKKKTHNKRQPKRRMNNKKRIELSEGFSVNIENTTDTPKARTKRNNKLVIKNKTPRFNEILGSFYRKEEQ